MVPVGESDQVMKQALRSSTLKRPLVAAGAAGLVGGATIFGYALLVEPMHIELEKLTVRLPNAAGRLPARGLRILQISDSHYSGRDRRERAKTARVAALVKDLEYDLLVHTGDFIHDDAGLDNVRTLLSVLPQPRLGSFAVFGNHDYTHYNMAMALPRMWRTFRRRDQQYWEQSDLLTRGFLSATRWLRYVQYVRNNPLDGLKTGDNDVAALQAVIAEFGMHELRNRAVHLHRPDAQVDIYLAGVDDYTQGTPDLPQALTTVPAHAPTILFSHNPDIIASPVLDRVDFVLSGHTHGGQLVLPLWGPAHTQSAHLSRENVAGYFRHGRTQFYVSRGMGEGIPLRFGAGPQVTLITLVAL